MPGSEVVYALLMKYPIVMGIGFALGFTSGVAGGLLAVWRK